MGNEVLPAKRVSLQSRRCRLRQDQFLAAFAKHGIVGAAAAECGVPLATVDNWSAGDVQGFKERRAQADRMALSVVEAEIHRRAITGYDKPIVYQGAVTGHYRDWSDNLLMFRAKRLDSNYKDGVLPSTAPATTNTQINIMLHPDATGRPATPA